MPAQSRPGPVAHALLLLGILLVALNLRPAVTSVPPLVESIQSDLGLSYAAVSLLTAIPVLCMGVFALLTPKMVRSFGRKTSIFLGLGVIGVATAIRVWSETAGLLFTTTIFVGMGIAICQTLLPSIVNAYYPHHIAFATGLYTACLSIGAALGSALTVPLRTILGTWPGALAIWAGLAVVAMVVWLPVFRIPEPASRDGTHDRDSSLAALPIRSVVAWVVTIFMGVVSTFFYAAITWLPARYISVGLSEARAGFLLTVFILAQLIAMGLISAFGDRTLDRRPWILGMTLAVLVGSTLIALFPLWYPWVTMTVFGIGVGGLFTLSLMLPADFATDGVATDRLSAMAFTGGYTLAAAGPYVVGVVLDFGASYTLIFLGFAVTATLLGGLSLYFSPGRTKVGTRG